MLPDTAHKAQANIVAALTLYLEHRENERPISSYLFPVNGNFLSSYTFFVSPFEPISPYQVVTRLPRLALEIQSPSNTLDDIRNKIRYLFAAGTKTIWIVHADTQIVEVATRFESEFLNIEDTLVGGDLLPDFSLPVREIFE